MDEELTFGQWLRRGRKARDLTQAELGRCVGCAAGTIRKLEADELRPSREVATRIAAQLGVPASEQEAFVAFARGQADAPAAPFAETRTESSAAGSGAPSSRSIARRSAPGASGVGGSSSSSSPPTASASSILARQSGQRARWAATTGLAASHSAPAA